MLDEELRIGAGGMDSATGGADCNQAYARRGRGGSRLLLTNHRGPSHGKVCYPGFSRRSSFVSVIPYLAEPGCSPG